MTDAENRRGTLITIATPRQELSIRKELDDVAMQTLHVLSMNKSSQKNKDDLDSEERRKRAMAESFVPQRRFEHRKSHPIFHEPADSLRPKTPRPPPSKVPNIPTYNELDQPQVNPNLKRPTKKYPYSKPEKVTTEEMRKVKKTATGVLPKPRNTLELQDLNVIIEGQHPAASNKLAHHIHHTITAVEDANVGPVPAQYTFESVSLPSMCENFQQETAKKPAILSNVGTAATVALASRPQPQVKKPSVDLEMVRKKAAVKEQKLKEKKRKEKQEEEQRQQLVDDRAESEASSSSLRSVLDLVDEARNIAAGTHPNKPRRRHKKAEPVVEEKPLVRTVDEIISSLKVKQHHGEIETDADRQIKEIMTRVMKHANAVLGGLDEKPQLNEQVEEAEQEVKTLVPGVETGQQTPDDNQQQQRLSVEGESSILQDAADVSDDVAENIIEEYVEEEQLKSSSQKTSLKSASSASTLEAEENQADEKTPSCKASGEPPSSDLYNLRSAYNDLILAPQVTHEDIVSVHGKVKTFVSKLLDDGRTKKQVAEHLANVHDTVKSYLSKYKQATSGKQPREARYREPDMRKNLHYFCTARHGVQMPSDMVKAVRLYHTPDQMKQALKNSWALQSNHDMPQNTIEISEVPDVVTDSQLARRRSAVAKAILDEASSKAAGMNYTEWQEKADSIFPDKFELSVTGNKTGIISDESRTLWSCAPPKMSIRPAAVREHLFPQYYGTVTDEKDESLHIKTELGDEFSDSDETREESYDPEERQNLSRVLMRRYHSAQDLTYLLKTKMEKEEEERRKEEQRVAAAVTERRDEEEVFEETSTLPSSRFSTPYPQQSLKKRFVSEHSISSDISLHGKAVRESVSITPKPMISSRSSSGFHYVNPTNTKGSTRAKTGPLDDVDIFPVEVIRRTTSAPSLVDLRDDFIAIPEDYQSVMAEVDKQRKQIKAMKKAQANKALYEGIKEERETSQSDVYFMSMEQVSRKRRELASAKPTLAEQAIAAGRNYVVIKKPSHRTKKKKPVDFSRLEDIEKFLYSKPNKLERTQSFYNIRKALPERSLRVPQHVRDRRRRSIPDLMNWQHYTADQEMPNGADQREWARDKWNTWFDEVFPASDNENDEAETESYADSESMDGRQIQSGATSAKKNAKGSAQTEKLVVITDEEFSKIEILDPLDEETEDELMLREALEEEIIKLTERMSDGKQPLPFDYCRLGAIQRKLGQLKNARTNLDKALQMEPELVHAYWQRHLLFLLQGKKTEALEDLNKILKINRTHAGAYISMAELVAPDDPTMAVTNLNQAIKLQPENADIYMRRAKLYEQRDQILLAMEDYAKAYKLNPSLTIAIFNRATYYFNQKNWQAAINDFTEFLRKKPFDAQARLLRGQAFNQLANHQKAVQDLSAAIHLDPNNWQAFYHRACIFRKALPKQALLDYSMSILINDSEDNIKSLLHRGVLYDALDQPEDAIADFEAILKLRKDVALAHLNLGLIYLTKMEAYQKAIRKFTSAIKCDPTFVRAYVCRAEAFTKIHDHKNALLDYTRAIHLRPDVPDYYMNRGMTLLKAGSTEQASFCVRHVSELFADSDLGQSATQQAVVHSFLKNYPKAILALDNAIKIGPNPQLYILLGKTQMKAKLWTDASESFSLALKAMNPFIARNLSQIADIQLLAAMGRQVQFTSSVRPWKPKDKWPKEAAEVNYSVGLCCLELRNFLRAHDAFNNAIDIDKKYAEAYYQRGVTKLRLKQSKGIQDINRALALDRTIFQAYLTRASYYGARGQFSKAIMNCNEAIKLKPLSVRAYLYRGALKCHIRAYELAIKDLTQATKIDNTCAIAYFNRAVCYHQSGQHHKALTDYGIVLLLGDQLMLKVLINRGLLYLNLKDYKNALNDFLLAARINNSDPKIRHTLGLCMHKLRKLKEAVAIFSEALTIDKYFLEAYISRGNAFLDYGNEAGIKAAQADYQRALLLKPEYLPARINLAYSLQMCGKFQQAWSQFTTAISQDDRCQAAYEGRAIINLQMSNLFAALQDVNASLKIRASAELHTNRGVINLFMKDYTGAMHDFQAAIKNDATYSLAFFNAANVYFKNRQFRQALAYYDRAIQYNERDESALVNRAITKAVIKDFTGARVDFDRALQLSPKSAHIYFNRGNLLSALGEWQKAEDDYCRALSIQPDDPLAHKKRADARGKLGMKEKAVEDYRYAIQLQARIKYLKTINTK